MIETPPDLHAAQRGIYIGRLTFARSLILSLQNEVKQVEAMLDRLPKEEKTMTKEEAIEHCTKLAKHLRNLDSHSLDAEAIDVVLKVLEKTQRYEQGLKDIKSHLEISFNSTCELMPTTWHIANNALGGKE